MAITTKAAAFKKLEISKYGIPFEAIRFLVDYGKDEEILAKVIYHLDNAYDESIFYDKKSNFLSDAPLWYSIVAEGQMDKKLIDSVISLYTVENDWDFLNEQGSYLLGKLCKEFGDLAIKKCIAKCLELNKEDSEVPYLYLFESLDFDDEGKYLDEILELLADPEGKWTTALIGHLASPKYSKLLPRLKELHDYYSKLEEESLLIRHTIIEINAAIDGIENGPKEEHLGPYYTSRSDWETHYKRFENRFAPPPIKQIKEKKKKIGRNDPCPCGSGKKYKKCCLH